MLKKPVQRARMLGNKRMSSVIDTSVIYCGDCLDQLQKLPDGCVDLIYPPLPIQPARVLGALSQTVERRSHLLDAQAQDRRVGPVEDPGSPN